MQLCNHGNTSDSSGDLISFVLQSRFIQVVEIRVKQGRLGRDASSGLIVHHFLRKVESRHHCHLVTRPMCGLCMQHISDRIIPLLLSASRLLHIIDLHSCTRGSYRHKCPDIPASSRRLPGRHPPQCRTAICQPTWERSVCSRATMGQNHPTTPSISARVQTMAQKLMTTPKENDCNQFPWCQSTNFLH